MVRICDKEYIDNENKYQHIFENYSFELDHFQKYAIHGIEENNHVLITAHTGSGKTLSAEYAIEKFYKEGKKTIYTAPIKSLSNQKFHEFTEKYPHISFGILTGDIKFNPEADCIIMTTEILRNSLFQQQMIKEGTIKKDNIELHFEMDIDTELGCVVFDEVHYINDKDRGKVWEETIMMLPNHVRMVMLSATIDKAEKFASWIENTKKTSVWLASTTKRVVPLTHYGYITIPESSYKKIKDKKMEELCKKYVNVPHIIRQHHDSFKDKTYYDIKKIIEYIHQKKIYIKKSFVLNQVIENLNKKKLLPAICFVFSRKQVELYASQIQHSLFDKETESKYPSQVLKECRNIIMKLPNYAEYLELPEYRQITTLLEKGIAIHHSGIMPVLREMVELLFSKGYIKLLFATETFAVGVNMPTKTVLFTNFKKFNGGDFRYLHSHEYTQMAGRAGRRGLDTFGHVIHLNNMFDLPFISEYKQMLLGGPQKLSSKFSIHFNLLLRLISVQTQGHDNFIKKSMIQESICKELEIVNKEVEEVKKQIVGEREWFKYETIPMETIEKYNTLRKKHSLMSRKKKKQLERQINSLEQENKDIKEKADKLLEIEKLEETYESLLKQKKNTENYIGDNIELILEVLCEEGFIENDKKTLTLKGLMATNMQEIHCLAFTEVYELLKDMDVDEIISYLACFTNIRVCDDCKVYDVDSLLVTDKVKRMINKTNDALNKYFDIEMKYRIESSNDYTFHLDMCDLMYQWCNAETEIECKKVYEEAKMYGIFTGEFVKAILKINNISNELQKIAKIDGSVKVQHVLSQVAEKTLKYVATNQSLYV